jgi:hypothetical protein
MTDYLVGVLVGERWFPVYSVKNGQAPNLLHANEQEARHTAFKVCRYNATETRVFAVEEHERGDMQTFQQVASGARVVVEYGLSDVLAYDANREGEE